MLRASNINENERKSITRTGTVRGKIKRDQEMYGRSVRRSYAEKKIGLSNFHKSD